MWIHRNFSKKLQNMASTRPVVLLTGARQTGKSSLLRHLFAEAEYVTFDHLAQMTAAREAPLEFLRRRTSPVILDEIQYVPELFRNLKIVVDENRDLTGAWLLTGSQQFELMKDISESLAGRIGIVHLETLSAKELRESHAPGISNHLWKGGYPELWKNPEIDATDFFESYLRTWVERDLQQLIRVRDLSNFRRFIRMLATRTGQLLNFADIGSDVGVSGVTVQTWLNALVVSGVIYLLPPWYGNVGKRLIRTAKIYFADIGLACHLLGVHDADALAVHPLKGNLFENFVLMELVKTHSLSPGRELFFYRDQNATEVDFVVEREGRIVLIEAKAGESTDRRRLHFTKVAPLMKAPVTCRLACGVDADHPLVMDGFTAFNPLLTDIVL